MKPIIPMEPISTEIVPAGDEWIAQIKWDGVRLLTYYDGQQTSLYNRKRHERTLHYPEVTDIHTYCEAKSIILDGEIIALGLDGKPSFHEVMRRDGIRRMEKVDQMKQIVPVTYMIFDILFLDGDWLDRLPLRERMAILAENIQPNDHIQLVSAHEDVQALYDVVKLHGMEGIVLKRLDSPYLIGQKKDLWMKKKNYQDLIAAIGGFTLRGGIVNAVLLGLYDAEGRFWYIGHTGTGKLSQQQWRELTELLRPTVCKDRPFVNKPERHADAYWVQPMFTVKIKYTEWTEGQSLRQPSIQALVDLSPDECRFSEDILSK